MASKWSNRFGRVFNPVQHGSALATALNEVTQPGIFNFHADNTRCLTRGLKAAVKKTGYTDHLVIGDGQSIRASTTIVNWPDRFRTYLASQNIPIAGSGWIRPTDGIGWDPRIAKTGTWKAAEQNLPMAKTVDNSATMTFTSDLPGTKVEVAYLALSGIFNVAIDGGEPVAVTPDNTSTIGLYSVENLPYQNHTVRITIAASQPEVFIHAFQVSKNYGFRIHNVGADGNSLDVFVTATGVGQLAWVASKMFPKVDVIHIGMATIGGMGGRPLTQTSLSLPLVKQMWPDADVILHTGWQVATDKGITWWPGYAELMYKTAESWDCPLIDPNGLAGGGAQAVLDGLFAGYYPLNDGSAFHALALSNALNVSKRLPELQPHSLNPTVPLRLVSTPPVSATAPGSRGDFAIANGKSFVCVSDNQWEGDFATGLVDE
jgi:hypothetical protein